MKTQLPEFTASGLRQADVAKARARFGPNELPTSEVRGFLRGLLGVVREPMFLLLLACGGIYLALGDVGEAMMLLGFVFVVLGITLHQEQKTERTLDALRDLSSPRALVVREGIRTRIAGRDVVPGDVVILAEGDRVPADAILREGTNLLTDESLLTGESVPVRKAASEGLGTVPQPGGAAGGDDLPYLYSGTLVVQGRGVAQVLTTGAHTELGKIGRALQSVEAEKTKLELEVSTLVRRVSLWGLILCLLVVILYGVTRSDWLHGVLAGITLAMALLPEEFPVVLTIFLALGARRLSKAGVLARRIPVIETLGSATVLCVDKTGTLTQNKMSVELLLVGDAEFSTEADGARPLAEQFHELVEFGILASHRDPFDPMEKAFHQFGERYLAETEHLHGDWILERGYPLSPGLLAVSHVWRSPGGDELVLAAKGAPEAVADLCHLPPEETVRILDKVTELAARGLRVLGVARGTYEDLPLPGEQHDFTFEFLGLVGLADPLRPSVPAAVAECATAGIRVVMITGDYPSTAQNIAARAGISHPGDLLTGPELESLSDAELAERVGTVNVFARMVPEQKLRLVNALKVNGEVVAMTGDGVNDAPALKAAHIGIAMGGRGTDVAREAASLVLLEDDFASIVLAVRTGRRIFDHLQKAMTYIVAVHVPIAGMSLLPVMFHWPIVLLPVHILFLELIIDPACSVVFEAEQEEKDVMRVPPDRFRESLFGPRLIALGCSQGLSVLAIVLAVYLSSLSGLLEANDLVALSFTTLVVANLGLIFANRSWSRTLVSMLKAPNQALWWVISGTVFFLGLALYVPFLRRLFHFTVLHPDDLILCLSAGFGSIFWFEALKWLRHRRESG